MNQVIETTDNPVQTIRFAPIRRDSYTGNLYVLSNEFTSFPEEITAHLEVFEKVGGHLAAWHIANPVERIAKFAIIEVPMDKPVSFSPL